jgi:hypothetical protein
MTTDQIDVAAATAFIADGTAELAEPDARDARLWFAAHGEELLDTLHVAIDEIVRMRAKVAELKEKIAATERLREEDQRRRDELDRWPGAGAG